VIQDNKKTRVGRWIYDALAHIATTKI